MSEFKLGQRIVELSTANNWDAAKLEWDLKEVYEAEEPGPCLCDHFPIIEICVFRNRTNGNHTIVGNCCVKKFIGLPSDKIFQAIKRIRRDTGKSLNEETIRHAYNSGWVTNWEMGFYLDIMRKRNLSSKQLKIKIQINEKVMRRMQRPSRKNG
jgi:hypothetical protein